MLASFATVTVLQRADRADLQSLPESEAIFEDLLNDPSLPPAGLLPSEDSFASDIPRGEVVGGGPTPEDQPVLVVSADTPSQSETQQHQSNVNENVPSLEQSAPDPSPPSADQDFDVSFDADAHSTSPVASNEPLEVDPDALPQTQHFEDDFEDDAASVGDKPDKPVSVKNPESKDAEAAIQNPKVASDAQNENIGDAPRQGSLKPSKKPTSDEALKNDKNADNGGKGNEQATSPAKDYPKKAQGDSGESGAVQDDPVIDLEIEHYGKDAKHKKGDIEKNKQTSGKGGENVKKVEICKEVDKLNQESKKDGEKEKASESASPQNTRSVRRRTARIGSAPAKTLITRSRTRSGNTPIVVGCSSKATNRKKQSTRGVSTKKTVVGDSVMKGDAPPQDGEKEGKATASKEEKKDSPKQGIDAEVVEVDDGDLVEEVKTDVDKICCEEKEATRCGVEVEKRGCKRKGDVEKEVEKEVDEGLKKPKNNVMEGAPGCNSKSYIDKLKAEMEELRRFRKRRNCNPIGFALDPDEFLPSLSNGSQSRKPEISFPPPCEPPKEAKSSVELVENREVEVPESAPM